MLKVFETSLIATLAVCLVFADVSANSTWDVLPTPLMMMEDAGIAPEADKIAEVLGDPTQPPRIRYWAALALAQLEAVAYLPLIIASLDDPVLLVQQGAMSALQFLPASDAVPTLCRKSSSDNNRDIRYHATLALFSIESDDATACIVSSATRASEDYQTRWQALYHLWSNRESSSAYDELIPTLDDKNATFSALAAMSLSKRYKSDAIAMRSLGIPTALGKALLDHSIDITTFKEGVELFELLTDTEIMLDPSKDIEYFNFENTGRAVVDERIQAWLDGGN